MGNRHGEIREIELTRDCTATMVPWGSSARLVAGSIAQITQQLGGNITVMVGGNLYRIAGADADALGMDPDDVGGADHGDDDHDHESATSAMVEEAAWRRLRTCYDPEIPIDIVDLGLVYLCQAIPLDDDSFRLDVRMTLTAPGCGMGTAIADEATAKLRSIPGVSAVDVDLVWDPPWSREMMSEAARLQLGLM